MFLHSFLFGKFNGGGGGGGLGGGEDGSGGGGGGGGGGALRLKGNVRGGIESDIRGTGFVSGVIDPITAGPRILVFDEFCRKPNRLFVPNLSYLGKVLSTWGHSSRTLCITAGFGDIKLG